MSMLDASICWMLVNFVYALIVLFTFTRIDIRLGLNQPWKLAQVIISSIEATYVGVWPGSFFLFLLLKRRN